MVHGPAAVAAQQAARLAHLGLAPDQSELVGAA